MLLNTDLHIVPGHARMTKAHFCENTMNTILHNMKGEQLAYLPGGLTLWKQDMLQHLKVKTQKKENCRFTRKSLVFNGAMGAMALRINDARWKRLLPHSLLLFIGAFH